jgi:hypothetical protein
MLLPPFGFSPRGRGSYRGEITYKIKGNSPMFIGERLAHIKPMRTHDLLRTPNVHTIDQ